MDIWKLDSQERICKATGLRRVFTHMNTQVTAIYRTLCANCGAEHLLRIPIEHPSRPPMVPNNQTATLCGECLSHGVTPVRQGRWGKGPARAAPEDTMPPKNHQCDPCCDDGA